MYLIVAFICGIQTLCCAWGYYIYISFDTVALVLIFAMYHDSCFKDVHTSCASLIYMFLLLIHLVPWLIENNN
jgi:hypothetical protein